LRVTGRSARCAACWWRRRLAIALVAAAELVPYSLNSLMRTWFVGCVSMRWPSQQHHALP
jgi:hypothetical protein